MPFKTFLCQKTCQKTFLIITSFSIGVSAVNRNKLFKLEIKIKNKKTNYKGISLIRALDLAETTLQISDRSVFSRIAHQQVMLINKWHLPNRLCTQ